MMEDEPQPEKEDHGNEVDEQQLQEEADERFGITSTPVVEAVQ